jgi:chemotaxis protein CheD
MDKQIIYAMTGEVKIENKDTILRSGAIGSCVVIIAYDKQQQIAAMAHTMLPGKAPGSKKLQKSRYAENAIDELANLFTLNGTNENNIEVCLAGGANVLERKDNDIGKDLIASVKKLLKDKGIEILAESLGGIMRRSVSLNGETGYVYFTIGDEAEKLLWKFSD